MGIDRESFFAKLDNKLLMRGWSNRPYALVNRCNGFVMTLSREEFDVIRLCDGKTPISFKAFQIWQKAVLGCFFLSGRVKRLDAPEPINLIQQYRYVDYPYVRGVQWEITGRCNMRCRHCYMGAPNGHEFEPDTDLLYSLLDKFCKANVTSLSLTGGEPFLRHDILELIGKIEKKGIFLRDIYTNATLVTRDHLDFLKERGISPYFRVSYDGVGRHDAMRGVPGSESKVLSAISLLVENDFLVSTVTCVSRESLDCLEATYEKMKQIGVNAWGISRPQPVGCAINMEIPEDIEFAEQCRQILERWVADGKPFTLGLEGLFSEGATGSPVFQRQPFDPEGYACDGCRDYPLVSHDGKMFPCLAYTETEYASRMPVLREISWKEAWDAFDFRKLCDIRKKEVIINIPECRECQWLEECQTGCRASALNTGGGLYGRDEFMCRIFRSGLRDKFRQIANDIRT